MGAQEAIGVGVMGKLFQILILPLAAAQLSCAEPAAELVLVVGAPGTPEYGAIFSESSESWQVAARQGGAKITAIGTENGKGGNSDRERLEEAVTAAAKSGLTPLWIVLVGHGTFDGREAKFNLRGEDVTAAMLAGWLDGSERPTAIIDTSASSAPFIKQLSKNGRIVMTATKSGAEDSYARFGQFLAESIHSPGADIDQDGATSLLEAFLAATKLVEEFYDKEGRIATEQALVDDNGDGFGTPASFFRGTRAVKSARDGTEPDGLRVHQWHLVPSRAEKNLAPELRKRRDGLEAELFALRAKKASMDEGRYFAELERIARALAEIYAAE